MNARVRFVVGCAVVGCLGLAVASCGSGGAHAPASPATHETGKAGATGAHGLANAIHPACGTDRFAKPETRRVLANGVRHWELLYTLPGAAPRVLGQPTVINLVQGPPARAEQLKGRHWEVIHGRKVSMRRATTKARVNAARWATRRAYYGVVTDGKTLKIIRRLVPCLP